jgi:hypothetical protein
MARLKEREYTYLTTVRGWCVSCQEPVPARVFLQDGKVLQQSLCPECTPEPALIAARQDWYLRETLQAFPLAAPAPGAQSPERGCPQDCGPCAWHCSPCHSVEITTSSEQEAADTVNWLIATFGYIGSLEIHGKCSAGIVSACRRLEVGKLVLHTCGNERPEELREWGVQVLVSVDGGARSSFIAELLRSGVPVTLESRLEKTGAALRLLEESDGIVELVVTAPAGIPVDAAAQVVCDQSGRQLRVTEFRPMPPAHPLCCLGTAWNRRSIRIHAPMHAGNFDCTRAMLCPHWTLLRPGVLAPACTRDLFKGEHRA